MLIGFQWIANYFKSDLKRFLGVCGLFSLNLRGFRYGNASAFKVILNFNFGPTVFEIWVVLFMNSMDWDTKGRLWRFRVTHTWYLLIPITYLWLDRNKGMDPYSSPYITHYNSVHVLFPSFIPS